jgi:hypothetical protein
MFGRLREIDEELSRLPDQLAPLEKQVERGREVLAQSEQNNPMRQVLPTLLRQAERNHVENLGWLVGLQSIDAGAVAAAVMKFMLGAVGKGGAGAAGGAAAPAGGEGAGAAAPSGVQAYEQSLSELVRIEGGSGLPPGTVEGVLARKLFGEPWLALEPNTRAHVMEDLKREAEENSRWLPEPKNQILDEEGRSLVGEGAGAFGGYFCAAALVSIGLRQYRLNPPTRGFSALGNTIGLLLEDALYKKIASRFLDSATTADRGRALLVVSYVYFIRSVQMGTYEREHRKITDALGSAEVALESGRKRIERLRTARSEIVMQNAGLIGITMTIVAIIAYALYALIMGDQPPPPKS